LLTEVPGSVLTVVARHYTECSLHLQAIFGTGCWNIRTAFLTWKTYTMNLLMPNDIHSAVTTT